MGIYFRKRIMKLPFGGRLTFGSGGFGLSFGKKNVRLHINSKGSYVNTRIPKTNIYVGKKIDTKVAPKNNEQGGCCSVKGFVGCIIWFMLISLIVSIFDIALTVFKGEDVNRDQVIGVLFILIIIIYGIWKGDKYKKGKRNSSI